MSKLISIVVNCYNGEKYLKKTLKSIQNQEYKNWELIFWDNQSSDNTKGIFESFDEPRFKYFYAYKHTTLYEARNLACKKTKGDFITFLDSDDWWYEDFLSSREKFFDDEKYKFSFSNFHYYFEKSDKFKTLTNIELPSGKIYNSLSKNYIVAISSLIVKKELLEKINFFNPEFNIIGDFDAVMKISKMEECYTIQKPVLVIRIHGNNFSDQHRKMYFKEYKSWYSMQERDELFFNNRFNFQKKLLRLYIISLVPNFLKDLLKKK
tara:strand:- start:370 stop:1164 length:795 start_codon:yes stop_codon:yes gene_type:complete